MNNEQIEAIVAEYDKSVAGKDSATRYRVSERINIEEGVQLVLVEYGDDKKWIGETSVIVYDEGDVFCQRDWSFNPTDRDGIADYEWVHVQTRHLAVVMNGLPRILI